MYIKGTSFSVRNLADFSLSVTAPIKLSTEHFVIKKVENLYDINIDFVLLEREE